jgi:D-alanine-D-alanine ligase
MTMKDNETLSGLTHEAAFTPTMRDLRADPAAAKTVAAIADAAGQLARLLGLTDCFSMDFRVTPEGRPLFLEFEVCPAVTIYDFQSYLRGAHGLTLGEALARSFRLAHRRAGGMGEA